MKEPHCASALLALIPPLDVAGSDEQESVMDPHSRHSQFNQRQPKSGPPARLINSMPLQPSSKPIVPPTTPMSPTDRRAAKSKAKITTTFAMTQRPIASNSRIRQSESLRRDMYLAFVNNALQEKAQGRSGPFDELVNQFNFKSNTTNSSSQLRSWLSALSHVVSKLERHHSALVEAIVNMPWTLLDSPTVKLYTVFMGMLLSARPEYLSLVLGKIVQGFTHRACASCRMQSPYSPGVFRILYSANHGSYIQSPLFFDIATSQSPHTSRNLRPPSLPPRPHSLPHPNAPLNPPTTHCEALPP